MRKKRNGYLLAGLALAVMCLTGCSQKTSVAENGTAAERGTVTESGIVTETDIETEAGTEGETGAAVRPGVALETNVEPEADDSSRPASVYYLQAEADADTSMVPSLTLFDDGTFGFSYDVLSSYYPRGTYEQDGEKLTATTDDGKHQYVFQVDGDRYIFLQEESSDTALINRNFGTSLADGSVFARKELEEESLVQMTAIVKEIREGGLLVSSRSDEFPGAYYVYIGEQDVSGIRGGDEIIITWNGIVLESEPGQIYAEKIEIQSKQEEGKF